MRVADGRLVGAEAVRDFASCVPAISRGGVAGAEAGAGSVVMQADAASKIAIANKNVLLILFMVHQGKHKELGHR
jgi:hypothetical protein